MAGLLGRLRGTTSPDPSAHHKTPTKKDPNAPQPTPLEKLLADAGPLRSDGSDKFFGFENFGSTCYCNSIVQCLYYSPPFREQVINFPTRSSPESLQRPVTIPPPLAPDAGSQQHGFGHALSPLKSKQTPVASPNSPQQKGKPPAAQGQQGQQNQKPEDKDSPEYKKKLAMAAGPILSMDYENSKAYGMPESLFTCLKDIFEAVIAHRSRIGIVSPHKFLEILRRDNEMFRTPMHQDAHEFLNLLLNEVVESVEKFSKQLGRGDGPSNGLNEALSPVVRATMPDAVLKNSPLTSRWVHELFEGTLTSETRCLTCENTSQRDEAFLDLSVDLEQHTSVTACLRKFSEEEMLCERNKFHCDKCGGLQEAEKRMKVKRLPRILALHLKRFKYTEDLQRLQKLFHRVVYPYYLRLFNTTDDAEDPDRLYELYAVVVHIGGGPYHGHYVSIIKTQDRGWLLFDDEMVEPVDKAYVRNFFGGEGNLACAYVLFYQETTLENMQREQEAESAAAATAPASEPLKESSPVLSKANGMNGMNGAFHGLPPSTPVTEEVDHFANLDHAVTAPLLSTAPPVGAPAPTLAPAISGPDMPFRSVPPHDQRPLSPAPVSPALPTLPFAAVRRRSAANLREERKREEKERKAAEKVAKAAEKEEEKRRQKEREQALKDRLAASREMHRQQDEELKAALAASRVSKAEEDRRTPGSGRGVAGTVGAGAALLDLALGGRENGNGNSHGNGNGASAATAPAPALGSSSLNRFRHSSMSLRGRPKFWPGKDKATEMAETSGAAQSPFAPVLATPVAADQSGAGASSSAAGAGAAAPVATLERSRSIFGIRKKSHS